MATVRKRQWTNKSGTHEAWVLAYTDKKGQRHKEQFAKKRDADTKRVEVEGQIRKGTFRADAANTSVADAAAEYVKHIEGRHRRDEKITALYLKTTKAHIANYIAPSDDQNVDFEGGIGSVKLAELSARAVGKFRDSLRDAGVSVPTTRAILGTLSRVLSYAVSEDLVAVNAAAGIKVIGKRDEGTEKVVPPSKAALAAVLKAADADSRVKLMFAAASGLRASELHALPWRNLDLANGEVTVDRRVDAFGNLDVTKSKAGKRAVPLGTPVVAALKEWRLRSKFSKDDDLVFPNTLGGFTPHTRMMKRKFRPLLADVAAKEKEEGRKFVPFGWHGLRHFAISTWIEAGLQPKTVQTFAGHSTLAVTMDRYGHMFPSDDHKSVMDGIAAAVFGGA
ncbi:MAG: site-specific integrase [Mesorhizobium sp.]|nr:MAG: site-specific integrase [Mesorhizobium sp.]